MQYHKYSLTELDGMIPFERDIYIQMLLDHMKEQEEKKRGDNDGVEDLELEELDQLSLFYAEHDDPDKDPDFAPNSTIKPNKKSIKKTKASLIPAANKNIKDK